MKHLGILCAALVLAATHPAAFGQPYPNKPIRIIVPYPAGESVDVITRLITQRWSALLGQQIIVDNRVGGGGLIGTGLAAKATADMLVRIFARCARNFALDVLARGGVYIGGGVVEKNLDWFTSGAFINEFERHRQYRPVLEQMPVSVITLRDAGMYGSAFVASKGEELWSRIV